MREVRFGISPACSCGADHPRVVRPVRPRGGIAITRHVRAPARLGQHPARQRRRPGDPLQSRRLEPVTVRRLDRRRRRATAFEVALIDLLLPADVDFVARCRLPGHPRGENPIERFGERLPASVEIDRPGIRVAGVLVHPHAGHGVVGRDLAVRRVEPQLVADDPAAAHRVDLVEAVQLGGRLESLVLQRLRVIAALHRAVRAVGHERSGEGVPALARDRVQRHAGCFRLAHPAGGAEHDFLSGGRRSACCPIARHRRRPIRRSARHCRCASRSPCPRGSGRRIRRRR